MYNPPPKIRQTLTPEYGIPSGSERQVQSQAHLSEYYHLCDYPPLKRTKSKSKAKLQSMTKL